MALRYSWIIGLTWLLLPLSANAAPADRAATIAPLIDEQTIAILYIDFGRVDVDAVFEKMGDADQNKQVSQRIRRARQALQSAVPPLRTAGAEAYCIFSLVDWPQPGPFVVVKIKPGMDRKPVVDALSTMHGGTCQVVGDLVYSGPLPTLQRIQKTTPAMRPQLGHALEAAGDAPVQLLIVPSEDHRRVFAEMMPQLPDEFGGGNGKPIADVQWAAVTVTQAPETSVGLTIQLTNAESAVGLKSTLASLYGALSRLPSVRTTVPNVDRLATLAMPRVDGSRLTLRIRETDGNLGEFFSTIAEPVAQAQTQASRVSCTNNLKQLALAMHNYHDAYSRLPSAFSRDKKNKALLSWRVHLLPFVDQDALYKQFHLDEPWDSEHNRTLINRMPAIFGCAEADLAGEGKTTYVVPVGDKAVFGGAEGMRIRDIRDGTSNTIMIVEVDSANAVIWTKPDDLQVDPPSKPSTKLGNLHGGEFPVALCDGSVLWMKRDIAVETLRLLFDPNDGQVIPPY